MAKWLVTYQTPKGVKDQTIVDGIDDSMNAKTLHEALEEGSIKNAFFVPDSIIFVQKID
jgi:hypothetical protein